MDRKSSATEYLVLLGQAGWSKAAIDAQLERLFSSKAFYDAEQARTSLLPYLVQEAFAGRVPTYADIAVVLGNKAPHPKETSARNAVGRLRKMMANYYKRPAKGDIRLEIPPKSYLVLASRNTASPEVDTAPVVSISEPLDNSEVYARVTVRGRIDSLDPDLRVWLVVLATDGFYYVQGRVSRRSRIFENFTRTGRMQWGEYEGVEFVIMLVAADVDGDFEFQSKMKEADEGFGRRLPSDTLVLASVKVIRRDIRPGGPTTDRIPPKSA